MKQFYIFAMLFCLGIAAAGPVLAQSSPGEANAAATTGEEPATLKSYRIVLNYSDNEIRLKEIDLIDAPPPARTIQPLVGWRCDVVNASNKALDSFLFDIPATVCSDAPDSSGNLTGGCVSKDKSYFSLGVPYYEKGVGIIIWRPDGKNYYINTIGFAKQCGDNICEVNENYATCVKDCRSGVKDGYCDKVSDGVCDPDCYALADKGKSFDGDCKELNSSNSATPWIAGGLIAVIGAGIWLARRKK